MHIQALLWAVLAVALTLSVLTDLLQRRILDLVTLPALLVLLGIRLVGEGPGAAETGLISGLIAAGGAALVFAVPAWRGRMGWGDVKLVAVVGAAFGYPLVMGALAFITLTGAVQAVATLLWLGEASRLWPKTKTSRGAQDSPAPPGEGRHIPYGVAIALGSAWTVWWKGAGG